MTEPGQYTTETGDMLLVHHALLHAFDAADALVASAGSDATKVGTVATFFENVLEFLHVHHEGEDELLYPLIEERCPEHKAMLEEIDAQHTLLYEPMAAARAAVASWASEPSAASGETVARLMDNVEDTLRPHLAAEETNVLPIASAYLSPEEWGALPGHSLQAFSADKPWLAFGLILEQMPDEQRAAALSHMPPAVHELWDQQWGPAFRGFIAEVRAIAPVG